MLVSSEFEQYKHSKRTSVSAVSILEVVDGCSGFFNELQDA